METKICNICRNEFSKPDWASEKRWERLKYCSQKCSMKNTLFCANTKPRKYSELSRNILAQNARNNILKETPEKRIARLQKTQKTTKERNSYGRPRLGLKGGLCPVWKGENATYNAKHRWIQCNWQKTGICEICLLERPARKGTRLKWGTHWANKSGEYKRDRTDWYELCPKCHKFFDKR